VNTAGAGGDGQVGAKFCSQCGVNMAGANFCGQCGTKAN
jgi:hypothetical protein